MKLYHKKLYILLNSKFSFLFQCFSTSGLSLPDIAVDTSDGAVFLHGYVDDQHMMELAEELVMEIQGVKKVKNYLKIRKD